MGGMYLRDYWFTRYVEVAEVCAEVKHKAKTIPGSNSSSTAGKPAPRCPWTSRQMATADPAAPQTN